MSIDVVIEGMGLWSPALPGWLASQEVLTGKAEPVIAAGARPAASLLAPAERRRAPDSVLLALDVAEQAAKMAGREGRTLRGVFASDHGDLTINDYLCATLSQVPEQLSPTKFHNPCNAPAGYRAIATGCMASTTALSAGVHVSPACSSSSARPKRRRAGIVRRMRPGRLGPLADVVSRRTPFAVALVLSPRRDRGGAARAPASHAGSAPFRLRGPSGLSMGHWAPAHRRAPARRRCLHGTGAAAGCMWRQSAGAQPAAAGRVDAPGRQTVTLQAGPRLSGTGDFTC
jgi:hypothetical protein